MRLISRSAILWRMCGRPRRARRRKLSRRGSFPVANSYPRRRGGCGNWLRQRLDDKIYEVAQVRARLARVHPRRRLNEWLQRLDDLQSNIARCAKQGVRQNQIGVRNLVERLTRVRPAQLLRAATRGAQSRKCSGCGNRPADRVRRTANSIGGTSGAICVCWVQRRCWRAVIPSRWTHPPARCCAMQRKRRRGRSCGRD